MNEYIDTLKDTSLFSGIEPQEIDGLLSASAQSMSNMPKAATSLRKETRYTILELYYQGMDALLSGIHPTG